MRLRRLFISPRVLQVCDVLLETDLLGLSKAADIAGVETTGHEISTGGNNSGATWSSTTAGDYFD